MGHVTRDTYVTCAAVMSVLTPALLSSSASCPPVSGSGPNFHPDSRRALNRPDSQNRPGQLISLINKAELMTISHQGLLITTKADTNACYIMKVGWQELPRGQWPVMGPACRGGGGQLWVLARVFVSVAEFWLEPWHVMGKLPRASSGHRWSRSHRPL